jgi:hypothetical protein
MVCVIFTFIELKWYAYRLTDLNQENSHFAVQIFCWRGFEVSYLIFPRHSHFFSVPSPQQKTLADYVEGILELDLRDIGLRGQNRRVVRTGEAAAAATRNLSPNLLRRKIEELKDSSSGGQR